MSKIYNGRGRPVENDTPLLQYTQEFREHTGEKFIWVWDKIKSPNAPLSVTIEDPQFNTSEKLLRELEKLEQKYQPKKGDRKPRITKVDKQRMEQIQKELEEFHYSIYPEDAPKTRGRKSRK